MTRAAKNFLICAGAVALVIAVAAILIATLTGGRSAVGENRIYDVEGRVKRLEIEIEAADFRIVTGEGFSVESNLKNLSFRQTGERLIISERTAGNPDYEGARLTVTIPEGAVFSEIDITVGAGRFTADIISGDEVNLEFGAAEVYIGSLYATHEADVEGGAGKITIGGGSVSDLQLEMGVGELVLESEILDGELDLGVGEARITLLGGREDYTIEINRGIGSISFDGEYLSMGGRFGDGDRRVEINGGVGSVFVDFE